MEPLLRRCRMTMATSALISTCPRGVNLMWSLLQSVPRALPDRTSRTWKTKKRLPCVSCGIGEVPISHHTSTVGKNMVILHFAMILLHIISEQHIFTGNMTERAPVLYVLYFYRLEKSAFSRPRLRQ